MATLVMKEIDNNNLFKNQVLSHTPVSQLSHNSSHKNEARQVSQLSRHIHNRSKSSNPTQRSNFIKIEDMNDDDDEQEQTSQFGFKADEPVSKVDFYHQEVDNRVAID